MNAGRQRDCKIIQFEPSELSVLGENSALVFRLLSSPLFFPAQWEKVTFSPRFS
jgi:hypothetical protein